MFQLYLNRPVLDHGWVYFDDDINIVLNPHLTGGSWDTVKWAWTDLNYVRRYLPLGWLMFDGLFALGGLNVTVFHAASWLLAAVNAILLFLIARKFLEPVHPATARAQRPWFDLCALLAVALFSVHPLRAETVGWTSALLYLASQCLAACAVLTTLHPGLPRQSRWPATGRELAGLLLFSLSLLVYPSCLGLPLVLILTEGARGTGAIPSPRGEAYLGALGKYAGWLLVGLLVGAINFFAAATSHAGFTPAAGVGGYPLWSRVQHMGSLATHYTGRIFCPGDTAIFYGTPAQLSQFTAQRSIALVVLGLAIVLLAGKRTRRATALFLALAVVSLLPFAGLLDQDQSACDRYVFLLLAVLAAGLARLLSQIASRSGRIAVATGLILLTAFTCRAYQAALAVWRNTDTVQARLESVTAPHPNARLGFARPAIIDFLRGRFELSRQRLAAGEKIFGRDPELAAAGKFIEDIRTRLGVTAGHDPTIAPYILLHVEMAREHQARGHTRAAEIHTLFASKIAPTPSAPPATSQP